MGGKYYNPYESFLIYDIEAKGYFNCKHSYKNYNDILLNVIDHTV